jgi:hypothetical protein
MAITDTCVHSDKSPPSSRATPLTRYAVLLVVGVLLAGLGLILTGVAAAFGAAVFQRGSDGYVFVTDRAVRRDTYAITSEHLDVVLDQGLPPSDSSTSEAGVVLRATSGSPGHDIFVGVGLQAEVARYLSEVEHSELTEIRFAPFRPSFRTSPGTQPPAPPAAQIFWTVSAQGPGTQQIESELRTGNWAVVIMNADGSKPVAVGLQAGLRSTFFTPVTVGGWSPAWSCWRQAS